MDEHFIGVKLESGGWLDARLDERAGKVSYAIDDTPHLTNI